MGKKPKAKPAEEEKEDSGGGGGKQVYIKDKEFCWIPATLISQNEKEAVVNVPQYKDEFVIISDGGKTAIGWKERTVKLADYAEYDFELPSQNVDPDTHDLIEEEDMVKLKYLHEVRKTTTTAITITFCVCVLTSHSNKTDLASEQSRVEQSRAKQPCFMQH